MLAVGQTAPDFSLNNQHGDTVTLSEYLAKGPALVYFYPADFSPVCTMEACTFRDHYDAATVDGLQIIGISPQSSASHRRFASLHRIPYPLLADTRKQVVRAYGVDGMFGIGVRRATFIIDQERRVTDRVVSDLLVSDHLNLLKANQLDAVDSNESL